MTDFSEDNEPVADAKPAFTIEQYRDKWCDRRRWGNPNCNCGACTDDDPVPPITLRTKTGHLLTEDDIQALADEAERGYDPAKLRARPAVIDVAFLTRQRDWSERTFGPGTHLKGLLAHIREELAEIEAAPGDLSEWIDVVVLALDGAWRCGHQPQDIIDEMHANRRRNEARTWPDWRTFGPDDSINHVREK